MALSIKGNYRIQNIYHGEGKPVAYLTLKDKVDGSQVKVAVPFPLAKGVVDDALVTFDGSLKSNVFQGGSLALSYDGVITPVSEK